ncbi:MAG TPA: FHA domain-containing protein [Nitrospirota bacterium]|nr:FHA domain-containing protein [Nitrospirota bacterium]
MKCKECQMENIEGALFCEECGAKLEERSEILGLEMETSGPKLVFASPEGSTLDIPAKDEVMIGREDPISEVFPDVDLTNLGGLEKGVSRKHAVIHHAGADYMVEDMGSTNGTFINKKRIQPHAPETIKPGDEVRFGKLSLSVKAA